MNDTLDHFFETFHSIVKARHYIGQKFSLQQNSRILDFSPAYVCACKLSMHVRQPFAEVLIPDARPFNNVFVKNPYKTSIIEMLGVKKNHNNI